MDDIGRLSIAREISRKNTDFFEADHRIDGMGGVTLSYVCPHCGSPFWMTTLGGHQRDTETATAERRSIVIGGVQHAEANMTCNRPTKILVL